MVHQRSVDILDIVFHVSQLVLRDLPVEVCAFGLLLGDYIAKHSSLPVFHDEYVKKALHSMTLRTAANVNSLRAEYMMGQLQRVFW